MCGPLICSLSGSMLWRQSLFSLAAATAAIQRNRNRSGFRVKRALAIPFISFCVYFSLEDAQFFLQRSWSLSAMPLAIDTCWVLVVAVVFAAAEGSLWLLQTTGQSSISKPTDTCKNFGVLTTSRVLALVNAQQTALL